MAIKWLKRGEMKLMYRGKDITSALTPADGGLFAAPVLTRKRDEQKAMRWEIEQQLTLPNIDSRDVYVDARVLVLGKDRVVSYEAFYKR